MLFAVLCCHAHLAHFFSDSPRYYFCSVSLFVSLFSRHRRRRRRLQAAGGIAPLPIANIDALALTFVRPLGGGHMDPYRTVVYYTLTHANGAAGNQARQPLFCVYLLFCVFCF